RSADDVLGPVDAQHPMDAAPASTPAPASTAEPASVPVAAPAASPPAAGAPEDSGAHHGIAAALRVSVLQGIGIEGIYGLSPYFNVRGQFNTFSYNRNFNKDGVDYDGKLKLQSIGALIDYHPFAGHFRLSLGLYNDGNKVKAHATCQPGNQCNVGDFIVTANPGDNPDLSAGLDMSRGVAPYFGFGWGNAMTGWPIHFGFDIGVMYQGKPNFSLAASGKAKVTNSDGVTCADPTTVGAGCEISDLSSNATFQSELAKQQQKTQSDIDGEAAAKWWPSIAFTIGYRFGG
ncbi:MAG TPA: hypothetical protein VHE37_10420, partial [Nevskiaceae bacterium]|nr:hypothetical protein [Nevskiaceae bacterium]